jgi:pimeloyl-ACP methyl ester carboxylesterase
VPTIELRDVSLHLEIRGSGPRLLVFNGSGATIAGSGPLIDALAAHFEVAVHDQRCLGQSTVPAAQPTMADYAADGLAILDHLGWAAAAVFGISFGGMVALEAAVTWPERIRRLALLCTSAGGAGGSSYPLHDLVDLAPAARVAIQRTVMDTRFTDEFLAEHAGARAAVEQMLAAASAPKSVEQRRGELMQLEARRHHDVWDRLDRITSPTLVACGRFDGQAPMANSEALHGRIASSELRVYGGGHMFAFQDRRALPEIVAFLAQGAVGAT